MSFTTRGDTDEGTSIEQSLEGHAVLEGFDGASHRPRDCAVRPLRPHAFLISRSESSESRVLSVSRWRVRYPSFV